MRRFWPGLAILVLFGCRSGGPPVASPPAPRVVTLRAGTPIHLVLLDELTSGGSEKGLEVHLATNEPLDGIPVMTPAIGHVSESRTEGTLGGLFNQPARLKLEFESLRLPDGTALPISADPAEAKEYEFNRANTGRPGDDDGAPSPSVDQAEEAVRELVTKGESGGLDANQVTELAQRMRMSETAKLAQDGRLDDAKTLLRQVRGGRAASLANAVPVAAAALELVNLAGDVGRKVGRQLGGRNIRAYPGTKVDVYLLQDATITLPPGA